MAPRNRIRAVVGSVGILTSLMLSAVLWYLFDQEYIMMHAPEVAVHPHAPRDMHATLWVVQDEKLVSYPVELTVPIQGGTGEVLAELVKQWVIIGQSMGFIAQRCKILDISYGADMGVLFVTLSAAPWPKSAQTRARWRFIQALCATIHGHLPEAVTALYLMQSEGNMLHDDYIFCGEPFKPAVHAAWPFIDQVGSSKAKPVRTLVGDIALYEPQVQGRLVADEAERVLALQMLKNWQEMFPAGMMRIVQAMDTGNPITHVHAINRMRPSVSIRAGLCPTQQSVPRVTLYVYGHRHTDGWKLAEHAGAFVPFTQVHRSHTATSYAYATRWAMAIQKIAGAHVQVNEVCVLPCASLVGRDHPAVYIEIELADRGLISEVSRLVGQALMDSMMYLD